MKFRYAAVILAIQNDFCIKEAILELLRQGVGKVLIISPEKYWLKPSRTRSPLDYEELAAIAHKTGAQIISTQFEAPEQPCRALYTEALYRNHAIEHLQKENAYDFVLTVDADELWLPGNLEEIDNIASENLVRPLTICLPVIPTIGVPGLPIAGAKDTLVIASSIDERFAWGRSTSGLRINAKTPLFHFSATRRTMEELIDKSRLSAHYDDSTYDFEGWLQRVVPYIHVGMKNLHMYKSEVNIWPETREWTAEEWAAIPETLHPYLWKSVPSQMRENS
jgi:hypothetical protein